MKVVLKGGADASTVMFRAAAPLTKGWRLSRRTGGSNEIRADLHEETSRSYSARERAASIDMGSRGLRQSRTRAVAPGQDLARRLPHRTEGE